MEVHLWLGSDGIVGRHYLSACKQEKVEDNYKNPDMLHAVNKADITGTIKAIKEYLRSYHGIIKVPHANIKITTLIVYNPK